MIKCTSRASFPREYSKKHLFFQILIGVLRRENAPLSSEQVVVLSRDFCNSGFKLAYYLRAFQRVRVKG